MMDEIKPGDVFELKVEAVQLVSQNSTQTWLMRDVSSDRRFYLNSDTLLAGRRVARPLAIGDRVTIRFGKQIGRIIAIEGSAAWIGWPCDGHSIEQLSNLERRAPAPDTKEGTT